MDASLVVAPVSETMLDDGDTVEGSGGAGCGGGTDELGELDADVVASLWNDWEEADTEFVKEGEADESSTARWEAVRGADLDDGALKLLVKCEIELEYDGAHEVSEAD